MPLEAALKRYQQQIEAALDRWLPAPNTPPNVLHEAMRYAVQGGKRLRAFLVLESARLHGIYDTDAMPAAAAVEALHAYSLVHDDLPCMDDDDLRRGLPTCHKKYGEALAILQQPAVQRGVLHLLHRGAGVNRKGGRRRGAAFSPQAFSRRNRAGQAAPAY